jgi:transcriptional regulator with XRE-family HTH domain
MEKSEFSIRLRVFCNSVSPSQAEFARTLGMKPQMLQKYLSGERLPLPGLLDKLNKLGCNINWLINGEGEMIYSKGLPNKKIKTIPIIGEVECGIPVQNQINADLKYLDVSDVAHLTNPFIAIARGESMRPYINPGDYLLCADEPAKIKDGRAVLVNFRSVPESYSTNAKLIKFLDDERIMLYSINTKFPPTIHKKRDIYRIYKVVRIIREVK